VAHHGVSSQRTTSPRSAAAAAIAEGRVADEDSLERSALAPTPVPAAELRNVERAARSRRRGLGSQGPPKDFRASLASIDRAKANSSCFFQKAADPCLVLGVT